MENKNTNKIVITVVAVALIIAVIGGATFAYWQWITNEEQQTVVNVTMTQGINMTITPEATTNNKLYPTNTTTNQIEDCTGTGEDIVCTLTNQAVMRSYAVVSIENQTGIMARPRFMLKLRIVTSDGQTEITNSATATPTDADALKYRDYIHYAVAEGGDTTNAADEAVYEGDCDSPIVTGTFSAWDDGKGENDDNEIGNTGWYNSPYITVVDDNGFPKITTKIPADSEDTSAVDATSVSFNAAPYTTTANKYKVCVWIDKDYTHVNEGDVVSDPLQDASIIVSWSEESEAIQVTE